MYIFLRANIVKSIYDKLSLYYKKFSIEELATDHSRTLRLQRGKKNFINTAKKISIPAS